MPMEVAANPLRTDDGRAGCRPGPSDVRVLVCRGCCCGTAKHPGTDHEAQVAAFRAACRTRVVGCLGECSQSNVIVVRRPSGERLWLGHVVSAASTAALCAWIAAGARVDMPPELAGLEFRPHRANQGLARAELARE